MILGFRTRSAIALALGAAITISAVAPAEASPPQQYVAHARVHATRTVVETVQVTVSASARAVAGTPPTRARVTVRVLVTAKGRATRTAWAVAEGSGPTRRAARRAARAAARLAARQEAEAKARSLARARALVEARLRGLVRARRAADRAARQKARVLAAQQAGAASGCRPLAKADGGTWNCTVDDEVDAILPASPSDAGASAYGSFSSSGRFAVRAAASSDDDVLQFWPTTGGTADPANRIDFPNAGAGSFHEYAIEWTPTTLTTLVDGQPVAVSSRAGDGTSPFDQPFSLLLGAGAADGGDAAGGVQIDWVRAWQ